MTEYIKSENKVGKQNNILRVGINYNISNIMRIKPGDYLRWIITKEKQIILKKVPSEEKDITLPDIINTVVKVSKHHNRITIPETIRLAANINHGDKLIWKISRENIYGDTLEVMKK